VKGSRPYVIVGANLAGASAAATLREEGFEAELVLVGAEPQAPYDRPPLSKDYLRGKTSFDQALVRPPDYYEHHDIEMLLGVRASRIDDAGRVVELDGGRRLPYDKVLVATGGTTRRLPLPGWDLEGVHDLRTVDDADRIRARIAGGARAVVVGMGFIGAEVAASLRLSGVEVTVIEFFPTALFAALGERIGRVMEAIHRDEGVVMHFGDPVASFEGAGRVERVTTRSGRRIECDFVVVGVGIVPATDVLAGSGVEIDNGVVVDEHCRTRVEGVYAAGDVANHFHPLVGQRMRVEHWQNALRQGAAAARSMLGKEEPYREVHWFWSDQYEHNLQSAGFHIEPDDIVVRGSLEERNFVELHLKGGRLVGAVGLNRAKELRRSMALIKNGTPVDPDKLKDPEVDVRAAVMR
jgi:3-phenylpropionate/trans-cinnamate dioxygenase ferredoxin reductase subunit